MPSSHSPYLAPAVKKPRTSTASVNLNFSSDDAAMILNAQLVHHQPDCRFSVMTHSVTACAKHQVRNNKMCHREHHQGLNGTIIALSLSCACCNSFSSQQMCKADAELFMLMRQKIKTAAGFGAGVESLQPAIGGAQTKLRLDSMEKFFCSQGLASPIEPPGAHAKSVR